jgi:hypothetical protein
MMVGAQARSPKESAVCGCSSSPHHSVRSISCHTWSGSTGRFRSAAIYSGSPEWRLLAPSRSARASSGHIRSWADSGVPEQTSNSRMTRALQLSPSSVRLCVLWRVAVHGLQLAMGEGESRRHVHLAAHDFDIGAGFAGAGRLHRFIEFAERGHTSGEPVSATKRLG